VKRLPVVGFAALVVATIAAFFITQHLKSSTPVIGPNVRAPQPFSNDGDGCRRRTSINFYLLHRSDRVSVLVVDSEGDVVQTVASGVEMHKPTARNDKVRRTFYWYGHEANGELAPNGTYYFRVALADQGRIVDLTQDPIVIDTVPPHLVVTSVSHAQLPAPGDAPATINFTGSKGRGGLLIIYRTGLSGAPKVATARRIPFSKPDSHGYAKTWNGTIDGRPAPAGTYVAALKVTDRACVTGTFPAYLPPQAGTTPNAGVTVSYLAAEPPIDPVPAGSVATVGVEANQHRYHWALRRVGGKAKPFEHGSGTSTSLRVRLPKRSAGLYELAIRTPGHRTVVPLVAALTRASGSSHHILVVLPALTWQGENPVDDNDDGFPDTLVSGGPILLDRPLADGLPAGFAGEAALLTYLARAGLSYDLTTDVALADGSGPALTGHSGVVFAGPELWLASDLATALQRYVEQGGRVLTLGADSLRRTATVKQTAAGLEARDPSPAAATGVLDARLGPVVSHNAEAIVPIRDGLGLFNGTSGTFDGFGSFQLIATVAPARTVAEAGTTAETPSIVGYRLGSGIVVDIGLPAFTTSLAHDIDTQELIRRLWTILSQ
jgi:hypothetical protein